MPYQRFKQQVPPATLANPATVHAAATESVAAVAIVAAPLLNIQGSAAQTVAELASVAGGKGDDGASARNEQAVEIAIALERASDRLRSRNYPPHDLSRRAYLLVAADLRNSMALYLPQSDSNRCHVCGEGESPDLPFVAVLSAAPDRPHWLHAACHAEHGRRIGARVEAMLRMPTDRA